MSTEVSASETATELTLPTVHPEVSELVNKPEDIWKRRRVLIRDIICTRMRCCCLFLSVADKGVSYIGKLVTVAGWTRTMRQQVCTPGSCSFCRVVVSSPSLC